MAPRRGTQGGRGAPHRPRPSRADRPHRPALRDILTRRRRLRPLRHPRCRDVPVGGPAPSAPAGSPPGSGRHRAQAGIPVPGRARDVLLRRPPRHRPAGARRARHPGGRHAHRPRAMGAGAAAPRPLRRARGGAEPGHAVRRAPQRDPPAEPPGGLGAPAPGRAARPAAAHVGSRSLRTAGLRGERSRPEPGQGAGRDRGGGAPAPPRRGGLDRGAAQAVRPDPARRPAPGRGLQPRAGQPREAGARDRHADAGERPRHGDGAHHARLRRRLGRPRQRRRRSRGRRRPRDGSPAARRAPLHAQAAVAHRGGGGGLLLRLRQRGPVAALPHRARAADVPPRGLAPVLGRQREVRGRGARGDRRDGRPGWS